MNVFYQSLLWLVFCSSAMAFPTRLEVWFLKSETSTFYLPSSDPQKKFQKWAQNEVCIPYGDQCFDPQKGIYDDPMKSKSGGEKAAQNSKKNSSELTQSPQLKNALESDMINCDQNYYFDLFCGKAKTPVLSDTHLEIWVDISSSLRELDSSSPDGRYCKRREVVERLKKLCGEGKVETVVFDTSFKRVVDLSQTCVSSGLNDQKRMMSWLENSQAKSLLFITDINEASMAFESFLRDHAAKVVEGKTFNEMISAIPGMGELCQAYK